MWYGICLRAHTGGHVMHLLSRVLRRTNWIELNCSSKLEFAKYNSAHTAACSQSTSWHWRAWPIMHGVTGSTWCISVQFSSSSVNAALRPRLFGGQMSYAGSIWHAVCCSVDRPYLWLTVVGQCLIYGLQALESWLNGVMTAIDHWLA